MAVSDNGYLVDPSPAALGVVAFAVNGVSFGGGVKSGDVHTVLHYVASQVAERVEAPDPSLGCYGYAYRANVNNPGVWSNHASGTAIDFNASLHGNGSAATSSWTSAQITEIHKILAEVNNVVRWGGDYNSTPDSMHFEINVVPAVLAIEAADLPTTGGTGGGGGGDGFQIYDTAIPVTDPMSLYPLRFMPTVTGEWFPCWGKADSFTRGVVAAIRWNGTTLDVGDLVDVPSDTQEGYDHLMRNGRTLTIQGFTSSAFGSTGRVYCYTADPSTGTLTMATLDSGTSDVHWGYGHYLTSPYGDVVVLVMNSDAGQARVRSYRIGADGAATLLWQNDGPIGVFTTIPQFDANNNGGALPVETNKLVFPYNSATLGGAKHALLVDLESPSPWYPVELPDLVYIDVPTGQPHWLATGESLGYARFYPGRPNGGKHVSGGGGRRPWNSDDGSTSPLVEYHWTGTSLDYVGVVAEEPRYPTPILGSTDFAFPEVSNGSGWVSEHYPLLRYSDDGNSTEWIIYTEDRRWAALINTSDDPANPGILSTRGLRLSTNCEMADGVPAWVDFDGTSGTAQVFKLGVGGGVVAEFATTVDESGWIFSFDGSLSTTSSGVIVDYLWDFADPVVYEPPQEVEGVLRDHIFEAVPAVYTVTLTVVTNGGQTASVSHPVIAGGGLISENPLDDYRYFSG